jgi:hypothetical protein
MDCAQCEELQTKEEEKYLDEESARRLEGMSDEELENLL